MSQSLHLYWASAAPAKARLRFCMIGQGSWLAGGGWAGYGAWVANLTAMFARPDHLTVLAGRPVLYLFDLAPSQWNASTWQPWAVALSALVNATLAVGLPRPYIVLQVFDAGQGAAAASAINTVYPAGGPLVEALSAYALPGGTAAGAPYTQLADATQSFWASCKGTGLDVAPVVPAGWDRRPRVVTPVPWEPPCQMGQPCSYFYQMPTPAQLGNLTAAAVRFVQDNAPGPTASGLLLISAWNEFDEGHYVAPMLPADGGSERLDAIGAALK
jgi:hypothetical protein